MFAPRQTAEAPWSPEPPSSEWQGLLVLSRKNKDPEKNGAALDSDDAELLGSMIVSHLTPEVWDLHVAPDDRTNNVHVDFSAHGSDMNGVLNTVLEPVLRGAMYAERFLGGFKTERAFIVDALTYAEEGDKVLTDERCDVTEIVVTKVGILSNVYELVQAKTIAF